MLLKQGIFFVYEKAFLGDKRNKTLEHMASSGLHLQRNMVKIMMLASNALRKTVRTF